MADVAIPERSRRPLTALGRLSKRQLDDLLASLRALPPLSSLDEVKGAVQSVVGDADEQHARALAQTIVAVAAQPDEDWSPNDIARVVSSSSTLELDDEQREALHAFLLGALELPSLANTAKAVGLIGEYERTVLNTRIVSDVRPIFGKDPDGAPEAAGVVHTLHLDYLDAGETRRMSIDLNQADLRKLEKESARALKKMESLKRWIEGTELTYFEYGEDSE